MLRRRQDPGASWCGMGDCMSPRPVEERAEGAGGAAIWRGSRWPTSSGSGSSTGCRWTSPESVLIPRPDTETLVEQAVSVAAAPAGVPGAGSVRRQRLRRSGHRRPGAPAHGWCWGSWTRGPCGSAGRISAATVSADRWCPCRRTLWPIRRPRLGDFDCHRVQPPLHSLRGHRRAGRLRPGL